MKKTDRGGAWARRTIAGLLALVLVLGLAPAAPAARAVDWAQEYLDKLVDWGVMRGDIDGNLYSDREITRAEFVTMVNRAYGYDEVGANPFEDVPNSAWYADDISIAYKVGYFTGTSQTTAAPDVGLTREQAAILLGRNMMLQEGAGETLGYSDSRDFSEWSRNMIEAASGAGIISGYPDGTFRPQDNITRGEVASMLVKALGTPIREAGTHSLGNVYGNVTISTSGVILRNTVIAGDLYLTGGIGLGDLLLENVTVLGRIVASGAGESSKGDSSIVLRNVTADEMLVDSIGNQFVTVRAEGDTLVGSTSVRTPAYLEDMTADDFGLRYIELNGEDGTTMQVAGNIKEVMNLTPDSHLVIAQGSADKVTVDEKAVDASMTIELGARVKELNLDVGTSVSGRGDLDHVNVSAPGTTVSVWPDTVTVRPGINANVAGETMDTVTAAEFSEDPRLMAGYPTARDVAPTSATAVFSTNKRGTIYWAVSALADGSVSEEDLISPPVYAGNILKSGTVQAAASRTEYTAKITGLTTDGSYYLTAILVDSRGQRSPVKVTAFTTPDDSVPNFATGFPVMSRITGNSAQVTVMTTKSCQLYYALLPKGSAAPKPQDFKSNAITGNLGYGSLSAVKNNTMPFTVNNIDLEELATYDLYLWLTDYDGAKSSPVKKLTFTTVDCTPPIVRHIDQTNALETSVEITYALNEPGTLYWAIVKEGDDFFRPLTGQNEIPQPTDEAAKTQVEAGIGAIKKGSSSANTADTEVKFTITGLTAQTAYDVYYVAKDKAGNYSVEVKKITVNTKDNQAPTVTQEFTRFNGDDKDTPLPDTNIRLVFSESIAGVGAAPDGSKRYYPFLEEYTKVLQAAEGPNKEDARENFAAFLRQYITMFEVSGGNREQVEERTSTSAAGAPWVLDYRYATVTMEDGKMVVTFPTDTKDPSKSALNLESGAAYFFHVENISDNAIKPNIMGSQDLPTFKTVFAQVNLKNSDIGTITVGTGDSATDVRLDISFDLDPVSTSKVPETECWDLILWCDTSVGFEVYRRVVNANGKPVNEDGTLLTGGDTGWEKVNASDDEASITAVGGEFSGISLTSDVATATGQAQFGALNELDENLTYQYGIHFTRIEDLRDYNTWSKMVTMKIGVASAGSGDLRTLAGNVTGNWDRLVDEQIVSSIGQAYTTQGTSTELTIRRQFSDRTAPEFHEDSPSFEVGSSAVKMSLGLDREGTIYYVVAPKSQFPPSVYQDPTDTSKGNIAINAENDKDVTSHIETYIPADGKDREAHKSDNYAGSENNPLATPTYLSIVNPRFANSPDVKFGTVNFTYAAQEILVEGLKPSTRDENKKLIPSEYYVYFVLKGGGEIFSPVYCYQFTMDEVEVPVVDVTSQSPNATLSTPGSESYLSYAVVEFNKLPTWIRAEFTSDDTSYAPPNADSTFTVLDAMTTIVPGQGGKSYFDVYAKDSLKNDVMRYIRGDTQESTAYEPENRWKDVQLGLGATEVGKLNEYMEPSLEYVVLATARHIYGGKDGDSYGFKAVRALHKSDDVPPSYDGEPLIMATITSAKLPTGITDPDPNATSWLNTQNPGLYVYSGTVTITFSKELYQLNGNIRNAVWAVAAGGNTKTTGTGPDAKAETVPNTISVIDALGGNKGRFTVADADVVKGPTNTFTLTFTDLPMAQGVTFFGSGEISNADGYRAEKKLTLTFDPTLQNKDYPGYFLETRQPGFRVEWK